ncbi:hypothetical protein Tco_0824739 [Tanacetum coccineum]|uniref:Uncharacterized protein n=1 Tax=Tanacetum coccineum TaxID=301880 RepID=A0ABQ5ALP3_9ASTR
MSANDNFSLHDDEELSLHDDASLDGSVPASNKGDAPAKPPQIITTNTLSNIKLPGSSPTQKNSLDEKKKGSEKLCCYMAVSTIISAFSWHGLCKRLGAIKDKVPKNSIHRREAWCGVSDEDANTDIQKTSYSSLTSDSVAFLSQAKASSSKHKPSHSSGS